MAPERQGQGGMRRLMSRREESLLPWRRKRLTKKEVRHFFFDWALSMERTKVEREGRRCRHKLVVLFPSFEDKGRQVQILSAKAWSHSFVSGWIVLLLEGKKQTVKRQ